MKAETKKVKFNNEVFATLITACKSGDLKQIKALKPDSSYLCVFDEFGYAPIHHAIANKHLEVVNCLLDLGTPVDLGKAGAPQYSLLNFAISLHFTDCISLLLERKAPINEFHKIPDGGAQTALSHAILEQNVFAARKIYAQGGKLRRGEFKETCLQFLDESCINLFKENWSLEGSLDVIFAILDPKIKNERLPQLKSIIAGKYLLKTKADTKQKSSEATTKISEDNWMLTNNLMDEEKRVLLVKLLIYATWLPPKAFDLPGSRHPILEIYQQTQQRNNHKISREKYFIEKMPLEVIWKKDHSIDVPASVFYNLFSKLEKLTRLFDIENNTLFFRGDIKRLTHYFFEKLCYYLIIMGNAALFDKFVSQYQLTGKVVGFFSDSSRMSHLAVQFASAELLDKLYTMTEGRIINDHFDLNILELIYKKYAGTELAQKIFLRSYRNPLTVTLNSKNSESHDKVLQWYEIHFKDQLETALHYFEFIDFGNDILQTKFNQVLRWVFDNVSENLVLSILQRNHSVALLNQIFNCIFHENETEDDSAIQAGLQNMEFIKNAFPEAFDDLVLATSNECLLLSNSGLLTMNWLANNVNAETLLALIKADNYEGFQRSAYSPGLEVAAWFLKHAPLDRTNMIKANDWAFIERLYDPEDAQLSLVRFTDLIFKYYPDLAEQLDNEIDPEVGREDLKELRTLLAPIAKQQRLKRENEFLSQQNRELRDQVERLQQQLVGEDERSNQAVITPPQFMFTTNTRAFHLPEIDDNAPEMEPEFKSRKVAK